MTTITFDTDLNLPKTRFRNLEEFQEALLLSQINSQLSPAQIELLEEREKDLEHNPNDFMSLSELKNSIKRK